MSHISIVEHLDGKSADWMEPVTDEQYKKYEEMTARGKKGGKKAEEKKSE